MPSQNQTTISKQPAKKGKDWSSLIQKQQDRTSEENKGRFSDARRALDSIPEDVMRNSKVSRHETFSVDSGENNVLASEDSISVRSIMLDVGVLDSNPYNARYFYDERRVEELAQSLIDDGQKIPLIVTKNSAKPSRYIIVDGEYRFRAATKSGLTSLRCDYYEDISKSDLYYLSNLLNEQRTAQTVFDNAKSWKKLLDDGVVSSASDLCELVKKGKSTISRTLAVNDLSDELLEILSFAVELGRSSSVGLNVAYEFSLVAKEISNDEAVKIAKELASGDMTAKDLAKIKKELSSNEQKAEEHKSYEKIFSDIDLIANDGKKLGVIKHDGKKLSLSIKIGVDASKDLALKLNDLIKNQIF